MSKATPIAKQRSETNTRFKTKGKQNKDRLLSEVAYEKIKEAIIVNDLAPGQEVSESQLAERFDMGKAPLRRALASLTQEGLVQPQSRRGYIIAPLTMKDIHDIWEIRFLLETEAARLAAGNVDEQYLKRLDRVCKKGYRHRDRTSQRAYLSANREFHLAICRASGNARLAKIVEQLIDHMSRMLFLGIVVSQSADEWEHGHSALVNALVKGDGDKAAAIMQEHLQSGREAVLNAVMNSPALMQVNLAPQM
ncbi:MAG: GntR family transcriptional regulator [Desulfobacterales bacterium]|nr:GntR family transcriptional regulator [Desulfobacterales bacterium]